MLDLWLLPLRLWVIWLEACARRPIAPLRLVHSTRLPRVHRSSS